MKKSAIYLVCVLLTLQCSKNDDTLSSEANKVMLKAVELNVPEKDKVCEDGVSISNTESEVFFSWQKLENAENYDLNVRNLNTQKEILISDISETSTKVVLEKGLPFSWTITAKSSNAVENSLSENWKFYLAGNGTANYAPFPSEQMSPVNGGSVTPESGQIELKWSGSDTDNDTLAYTLFLDTVDGKQEPPEEWQEMTTTGIMVDVDPDTVYYWRIKATDGIHSSYSETWTFTIP